MFVLPIAVVLGIGYYLNQIKPPTNVAAKPVEKSRALPRAVDRPPPKIPPRHTTTFNDRVPPINLHPDEVLKPKGFNVDKMDNLDRRMENYTGNTPDAYKVNKEERRAAFHDTRAQFRPIDMRQLEEERLPRSTIHNNVLPFEQIKMTPGLGLGHKATPDDPLQQYLYQKEIEKQGLITTEQLRPVDQPKTDNVPSRIMGAPNLGYKPHAPGKYTHKTHKKVTELGPSSWIRTTGSFLKGLLRPKKVLTKPQWRGIKDTGPYTFQGMASQNSKQAVGGINSGIRRSQHGPVQDMFRGTANIRKHGLADDRGRKSILLRPTERTHPRYARVRYGNATSRVNAMTMPILQKLQTLRRLYDIKNTARGNLSGPLKGPAYDPETSKARTTNRQTTITPTPAMNFSGPLKGVAYDPETQVARTTVKETTLSSTPFANLSGPLKGIVYDPETVKARTTNRETTLSSTPAMNLSGPQKMSVQNGVARTTLRQLISHVGTPAMNFSGPLKSIAYDPEQVARTTLKETILTDLRARHGGNLDSGYRALGSELYDTRNKDYARPTHREDYDESDIFRNLEGPNTLPMKEYDAFADPTMRSFLGETNYMGGGAEKDVKAPSARLEVQDLEEQIRETMRGLEEIEHYTPSQGSGKGAYENQTGEGMKDTTRGLSESLDFRGAHYKNSKESKERDGKHTQIGSHRDVASMKAKRLPPIKEGTKTFEVKEGKPNPYKALGKNEEQTERNDNMVQRKISEHSRQNMQTLERDPLGERTRKTPKWKEDASGEDLMNLERECVKKNYKNNPFSVPSGLFTI
jgi:hypothetical protein